MTRPGGERPCSLPSASMSSKDRLDAYRLSDGQRIQVTNDEAGCKALIGWIGRAEPPLVVFEATGAYHRQLEAALGASGLPFAKVNPGRRAGSPRPTGRLAKTDRVDAAMLARMGAVLDLAEQAAPRQDPERASRTCGRPACAGQGPHRREDRAFASRSCPWSSVSSTPASGRSRRSWPRSTPPCRQGREGRAMSRKRAILVSIPGIGGATALAMLVEMPELGTLGAKQAASLAGLAPFPAIRQVAGKERIRGGRPLPPTRHLHAGTGRDPLQSGHESDIRSLIPAGKPAKLAITAVMRSSSSWPTPSSATTANGPKSALDQDGYSEIRHKLAASQ